MAHWISTIRPYLESLYFLSGIILIGSVFIGLRQLKLLQKDLTDKNKRAAVEKSIEYLNWFATDFIPVVNQYNDDFAKKDLEHYNGPMNDEFVFDRNCNSSSKYIKDILSANFDCGAINLLNQLEFFSAAMLSGLADEELAFNPLSEIYCRFVERMYVLICYHRNSLDEDDDKMTMFSNTIKLYLIWKGRINKKKLENKKNKLEQSISKIKEERIKSIGS